MDFEAFAVWLMVMAVAILCYGGAVGFIHLYRVEKRDRCPTLPPVLMLIVSVIFMMVGTSFAIGSFYAYDDVHRNNVIMEDYYGNYQDR